MKFVYLFFVFVFAVACTTKTAPANVDVESQLKSAMVDYLYKSHDYDSSNVKYKIEKIAYYDDRTRYICEFKVRMITKGGFDTTGSMKAYISSNFKDVERAY